MSLSSITKIPGIMRANSWLNGAALMDKWFSGPPSTKPSYTTPDTSTLKMDKFVLTFDRAKSVFADMQSKKIWSSAKAISAVWPTRIPVIGYTTFDFTAKSAQQLHDLHVNFGKVGDGYGLDDLLAALGHFAIYVAPLTGQIVRQGAQSKVTLNSVAYMVVDSYDFNGDQDLGYWSDSDNTASAMPWFGRDKVENKSFRDWRTKNGRGGDFQVYSDVKTVTLNPPDSFVV
ncbi:MAG TPA: DUF6402 family protein [Bryobacteraceae bacterium]|jgi:hypothetical protein